MTISTFVLTALAMLAFAGNSLLCRLALKQAEIDPASFTTLRIFSGALVLWLLLRRQNSAPAGNWSSAMYLFVYAAAFSFAYTSLEAGTGALLLFGAVQITMLTHGLLQGERFNRWATLGLLMALGGLIALLLPGVTAPPLIGALLMLASGIAWGFYSLKGRAVTSPLAATAGNFLLASVPALLISLASIANSHSDVKGALYAVLSGAVTSGIGYALWYTALRGLGSLQAATVQLSVPVLTALAGALLLGEALTLRLLLTALAVLGGIALVLNTRQKS
ncbi:MULTISPECIES: DMT family transporter [Pseudomonas]|uniref:DMT family transporter n=1 Tax=Pseudomonas TaxID=286 RepID=UPI0028998BBA|nr:MULTISPECIES: DMT family transporter [Pseudomonas]